MQGDYFYVDEPFDPPVACGSNGGYDEADHYAQATTPSVTRYT